ncbi:17-beta-hydroxysteroid dehydrogenase 13-like [Ochlerotatus camptorhynchus]|uniref:17-beta-hydroxysteroid dehydrogenase 13-like n=1 Tax=Ochlerotatus camptorhynchus TaxID=644619 RepID=UPI0031DA95A2
MKELKNRSGEEFTESVPINVFMELFSMLMDIVKAILMALAVLVVTIIRILIPPKPKDVSGQTVLITGAGNGLGKAMAHEFASRGSNVVVVDVDLVAAEQTCEELRRKQVAAYAFQVDVSSYEQVEALAASVHKNVGPVDVLINNAGVVSFNFLRDANEDIINLMIDVNVKGTIWITKHFLPKMTELRRGHIVFISSLAGIHALPWATVYSTSKHAVNGLMSAVTEQLRLEGYGDQIRTTCVNPYYIATRKDIVDFLKKPRFEVLTTESTAQTIVQRVLQNETTVTVPRFFGLGIRMMQLFPIGIQQIIRDYIMREYELNSS